MCGVVQYFSRTWQRIELGCAKFDMHAILLCKNNQNSKQFEYELMVK